MESSALPVTPASSAAAPDVVPSWLRSFDLACCVLALPVLSVSVLLMTAVVRFTSPGPLFFRQERIGYRGRRFQILKFRTMKVAADTAIHQRHVQALMNSNAPMEKLDARGDTRLIPGGWILRASGLDELPQIINVLRGEMSFVGPRPCLPAEFEQYLPPHRERTHALPGLTGLWQVSGKNRTTFEEMMRLDIHYVRNVSPILYLKILVLTPWALIVQLSDTRRARASVTHAATAPSLRETASHAPAMDR